MNVGLPRKLFSNCPLIYRLFTMNVQNEPIPLISHSFHAPSQICPITQTPPSHLVPEKRRLPTLHPMQSPKNPTNPPYCNLYQGRHPRAGSRHSYHIPLQKKQPQRKPLPHIGARHAVPLLTP